MINWVKTDWKESFTWSNKKFKEWKNNFKKLFKEKYLISFNQYVTNSQEREAIYKHIFKMGKTDVFWTWNIWIKVEIEKLNKSLEIAKTLGI